jgi:hypothetical protein
LKWTPRADAVCNGEICAFAWLEPESYGEQKGNVIFSSAGKYHFTEDKIVRDARMFFRNDTTNMTRIDGFTGNPTSGIAVSSITPASGDMWEVLETWIVRDEKGKYAFSYHLSNTIPFGNIPFYFRQHDPDAGKYQVAILVKDMDGKDYFQFAPVIITK